MDKGGDGVPRRGHTEQPQDRHLRQVRGLDAGVRGGGVVVDLDLLEDWDGVVGMGGWSGGEGWVEGWRSKKSKVRHPSRAPLVSLPPSTLAQRRRLNGTRGDGGRAKSVCGRAHAQTQTRAME